ncbi:SIR2 family protein [Chryseobacterium culicis]|uniref:SIR2 family protein n=1 Tax=Chryseobacterium culicis TaxID=680127 RepID=UPI0018764D88|nr:SIR2 family protein [Chryseobacterium culicis]MBE4950725.1 SIR2 family protein [Chryseobacterium culicis]
MKTQFETDLEKHLKIFNTSPYLFIGSGFSTRYIKTEGWGSLLDNVSKEIKLSKNFHYYKSKAENDFPLVSTYMAEDLFDNWWNSDIFEESRRDFEKQSINMESPFKYEICKYLSKNNYEIDIDNEEEYRLFKKINIEGILTTNWDLLLEKTFTDFNVFIGQEKLIFNNSFDVGEIYKIHGCVSEPNSLVVSKNDYDLFHEKNPYLAAKLLTIFMEHPIIFIGYKIGDANIHTILESIINILNEENIDKLKDRLIFCERDNAITETSITDGNYLIGNGRINLPIKKIKYKSLNELYNVLANNNRRLPLKILRHMKHMVYDFVKSSKPKSKVYLADDTNIDNLDLEKVEFVYGFGLKDALASRGLKGIDSRDLLLDSIEDDLNFDPLSVTKNALSQIQGKYLPYFKYLRNSNLLDNNGLIPANDETKELSPDFINLINDIKESDFYPANNYLLKKDFVNSTYNSISELIANENERHKVLYIPLLEVNKIDVEELYSFLKAKNLKKENLDTDLRKLICLYDYLKYKLQK